MSRKLHYKGDLRDQFSLGDELILTNTVSDFYRDETGQDVDYVTYTVYGTTYDPYLDRTTVHLEEVL